jgi:hypothetical protein
VLFALQSVAGVHVQLLIDNQSAAFGLINLTQRQRPGGSW